MSVKINESEYGSVDKLKVKRMEINIPDKH